MGAGEACVCFFVGTLRVNQPNVSRHLAYLRRAGIVATSEGGPSVYDDGCLRVEHDHYYVACRGRQIALVRAEFLIVSRLARDIERFVEAESIWGHVWGDRKPYNADSLRVCVSRLRRTLEPLRCPATP